MKRSSTRLVLAAILVAGAWLLAVRSPGFLPQHEPVPQLEPQASGLGQKGGGGHNIVNANANGKAGKASAAVRDRGPARRSASTIFFDSKLHDVDRFHSLMDLVNQRDPDARYFAYRMRERCRLAGTASKDTILPELWSDTMERALDVLKARCRPLAEDPVFQNFADQVKDWTYEPFTDDIEHDIKKAFANSGAMAAVSTALAAFRKRSDGPIAMSVSETLAELGILKYVEDFQMEGDAAVFPNMQRDLFQTALMLRSCDFGVPCGPGSDRMLRICGLGGGCQHSQDLYAYYAYTLSPENMRNVEAILDALRQRQPAHSE